MDRDTFLKHRLPERVVAVGGVGEVRVRGLSRSEVVKLKGLTEDEDAAEVWMLAVAMIDPPLTEDDIRAWRDAAVAGEVEEILAAVGELSGLRNNVADAAATFPAEPGVAGGIPGG